jgi:hypothetical protein
MGLMMGTERKRGCPEESTLRVFLEHLISEPFLVHKWQAIKLIVSYMFFSHHQETLSRSAT